MELEFKELDYPEISRTYVFPKEQFFTVNGVESIAVSKSGSHRLNTTSGEKFIIHPSWLAIIIDTDNWSF